MKSKQQQAKPPQQQTNNSPPGSFVVSTVKSAFKSTSTLKADIVIPPTAPSMLPITTTSRVAQSISATSESGDSDDYDEYQSHLLVESLPNGNQHHFDVFRSVLSPATSENEFDLLRSSDRVGFSLNKEAEMGGGGDEVTLPDFDVDPLELCHLIFSIVNTISQDDSKKVDLTPSKHVSIELLPVLSELLLTVHKEFVVGQTNSKQQPQSIVGWTTKDYLEVERLCIRAILCSMYSLGLQANGVVQLQNTQVIPILLEVGHDHRRIINESSHSPDIYLHKRIQICSELNEGMFSLVVAILKNIAVNPSAISTTLYILKDYANKFGFEMCQHLLRILSEAEASDAPPTSSSPPLDAASGLRLIKTISSLVTEMKKLKVSYIHTVKCSKKGHKNCDYSPWQHHHHDILNVVGGTFHLTGDVQEFSSTNNLTGTSCMVNMVVEFLLDTLKKCKDKQRAVRVKILSCLEECGVCCCISPEVIVRNMLADIEKQTVGLRQSTMTLLCRLLLEQCGGQKPQERTQHKLKVQCHVCELSPFTLSDCVGSLPRTPVSLDDSTAVPMTTNLYSMSDSAFSSSENNFEPGTANVSQPKWNCIQGLREVVMNQDPVLSTQAMKHVLKLVCQGNDTLKMQLFQNIFMPVIISVWNGRLQHVTAGGSLDQVLVNHDVPVKVVNYCLNSLPLLLQVFPVFQLFLNTGGIKTLCLFLEENDFRQAACKVFQMLVILEEQFEDVNSKKRQQLEVSVHKSWEGSNAKTDDRPVLRGSTSTWMDSVDIASGSESDEKDICIDTLLKLLCDYDISVSDGYVSVQQPQIPQSKDIAGRAAQQDPEASSSTTELKKDEIICELWNSANVLLLHSHKFKKQFFASLAPKVALRYFNECVEFVATCNCDDIDSGVFDIRKRSSKFACKMSLLHSILSVCLVCRKHNANKHDKQVRYCLLLLNTFLFQLKVTVICMVAVSLIKHKEDIKVKSTLYVLFVDCCRLYNNITKSTSYKYSSKVNFLFL